MKQTRPSFTTKWVDLPAGVSADIPCFVLSDIHGMSRLLAWAIAYASENSEGHVFAHLGDVIDRGPDPMEAISCLLRARQNSAFSRVITLMGNHEQVLLDLVNGSPYGAESVFRMGGRRILEALADKPEETLSTLQEYVSGLSSFWHNGGLALTHAVPDPGCRIDDQTELSLMWSAGNQEYRGGWDRLLDRRTVLVHGHTATGPELRGGAADVVHELNANLAAYGRIPVDTGPFPRKTLGLFEFRGGAVRVHAFIS